MRVSEWEGKKWMTDAAATAADTNNDCNCY